MVKPRIPHLCQPPNSVTCLPVCTRMAMLAFGCDYSIEDLKKWMSTRKTGTNMRKAACVLSSLGFNVHYYDQPYKIPARYIVNRNDKKFYDYIKRSKKFNDWKLMLNVGVVAKPRHSSIYHMSKMIESGHIAIAAVRPRILLKSKRNGYKGGHAIIVKRIDFKNNRVYIIDPANRSKRRASYTIDHFESARNMYDHVIFVKRNKNEKVVSNT